MKLNEKCKNCERKCKYYFDVKIESFYCKKFKEKK